MAKSDRLTPQQENFAVAYVRCGVASRAYREAYKVKPETTKDSCYQAASHLLASNKIAARVRELQEKAADVTIGELVQGFRNARDMALDLDLPAAATGAGQALARIKGFLKDDPSKAGDIHIHFDVSDKSLL